MAQPSRSNAGRRGCLIAVAVLACAGATLVASLCLGAWTIGNQMDAGPIALTEVSADWSVDGDSSATASDIAATLLRDCRPMANGIGVLFHHAWYNTLTTGYDRQVWLQAPTGRYDSFGLYLWSNKVFLRDETSARGYDNQVLVCDTTTWTW